MMPTKTLTVSNWGGNMGVRLPKDFAEIVGIEHKSKVQAKIVDGAIMIFPIKTSRNHIPLAERMAKAIEDKIWNGEPSEITQEDREWLDMPSVGEEIAW
jgi:antitoxin component of MazEF toxin-antitoxin module